MSLLTPSIYAQKNSAKQPNNVPHNKDTQKKDNPPEVARELIRVNKSVSEGISRAAEAIDESISPASPGEVEVNKSQVFFIVGGDFDEKGKMKTNFRYGAKLHLPRFQKYWKLKFENQDEKRDRGSSAVTRKRRTRNANDDIFVGVSLSKKWEDIDISYEPKVSFSDGMGLDHSIEAEVEYVNGDFSFEPTFEFFANNGEGTGVSGAVKFTYWIKEFLAMVQGNDGRHLFLEHELSVNHYVGLLYKATDRLVFNTNYFRTYSNKDNYSLSAYGVYLATNYMIYQEVLAVEVTPYLVHEREESFSETKGFTLNFRIIF